MIDGRRMAVKPQRFLFETSFDGRHHASPDDAPEVKTEGGQAAPACDAQLEEQPEAAAAITELDLVEEKAKAFTEGEARGREAALAEINGSLESRSGALLEQLAGQLPDLVRAEQEAFLSANRECLALATAALRKLFPSFEPQDALQEIEALLEESLAQLRQEPRIVVRLQDAQLDPLKGKLDDLTHRHGFEGKVVLLADAELGPSDVRIEFADGGIERCARQLWAEIETRLNETRSRLDAAMAPTDITPSPPAQDES